jgi:retinol dehydrogenase-13
MPEDVVVEGKRSRGAKVYLACRSLERAQAAVADILQATGVDASQLPIMHLDLGSLQSIRDFARDFKKKENHLDILINNAGQMFVPQSKTIDGFETTFGVNHLGPFLLTHLLIDLMTTGNSPGRIINVSALLYERFGPMNFDDLMMENGYNSLLSYSQSKLANILHARELARRLKGTQVTTYSLHPGVIRTELSRHVLPSFLKDNVVGRTLLYYLTWPFLKEPWNGAQTTICCAVDSKLAVQSGKYYSDCAEVELTANALDDNAAKRLWDVSINLVRLTDDEIHPLLRG